MKRVLAVLLVLSLFVVTLPLAGCGSQKAATPEPANSAPATEKKLVPLTINLPTWTGYGPLFLAKEKGFFSKHGLDVNLVIIEGLGERKQALAANKVQGMATALDVLVTVAASDIPVKIVWGLDDSFGADGILAKASIKTPADLKGKTVALEVGSASHLLLLSVLEKAGLKEEDVKITPMKAGDAGAAFVAGKVDAAVTWEPWLTKGVKAGGKLLASTKEFPGIIFDAVGLREDFVKANPAAVQGFVQAMAEAMEYWKNHKDESNEIMAKGLKISSQEFTETLSSLKLYDLADNKGFFGSADKPGTIFKNFDRIADFYLAKKLINKKPAAKDYIDPTYINAAK